MKNLIVVIISLNFTSPAFAESTETKTNLLQEVQSLAGCYGVLATFRQYFFELEIIGSEYADTQKLEAALLMLVSKVKLVEENILSSYSENEHARVKESLKRAAMVASAESSAVTSMGFNLGAEHHEFHTQNSTERFCAGMLD
jgi:hypothetical protein